MKKAIAILSVAFTVSVAQAYELGTHARTTQAAYMKSILATDATLLDDLGIQAGDNPFGEKYYDISGSTVKERGIFDGFELKHMPSSARPLSISGWLMRGAIREDDAKGEGNPQDDPFNPDLKRPLHHFFDPVNNRPLSVPGLTLIDSDVHTAPNWAVGGRDVFTQPNVAEANRRNHFTVFDAREAMYRALTGRDSQGNVIAATEAERNKYWATTFRALGDVVHLVQDMGQPQHTRNDAHAGKFPTSLTGHASVFEKYIDARATGAASYSIDSMTVKQLPPLIYAGYPLPTFTKYSDFWSTRNGVSGRGLADYSNRGFFSAGTNLGSSGYTSPSNDPASYTPESASGLLPNQPLQKINFLKGDVYDYNLNPGTANIRMTTESLFDYFLFTKKTYSFNRFNYNDMADLLIPRAVGYSAGLINYFFRGKIDVVPDPTNAGKYIIKNLGPEDMKGTFTLYYDAADGKRYPVAGAAPDKTWTDIVIAKGGQADNLSFTPPTDPAPKNPGEYILVFNGDMGEEKSIPGTTVGAIAAKRVAAAYHGVLYIVGKDVAGRLVSFKADKTGTHTISYYDADGTKVSTGEFDPLENVVNGQTVLPKAYVSKQVNFTQSISGLRYRTLSATFQTWWGGFVVDAFDPASNSYLSVGTGNIAWTGRSLDPQVGEFIFTLIRGADSYSGRVVYTRKYKDQNGLVKSVYGGEFMLPALSNDYTINYGNIATKGVFISADGFQVCGLQRRHLLPATAVFVGEGLWVPHEETITQSGSISLICLNIAASQNPVATLSVDHEFPTSQFTKHVSHFPSYWGGVYYIYYFSDTKFSNNYGGYIGYINNALEKWTAQQLHHKVTNQDTRTTPPLYEGTEDNSDITTFAQGTLQVSSNSSGPSSDGYIRLPLGAGDRLVRALTNNANNAIYTYATGKTMFREVDVTDGRYVADASPLGEVFFAKSDMSMVIHEPLPGGMPKVVMPSIVVKLLAAVWM